jgi:aldehyde dehydrogenase (NAD+)
VEPEKRGIYLVNLANLFEQHAETLAKIESLDNGKAVTMAREDISSAVG